MSVLQSSPFNLTADITSQDDSINLIYSTQGWTQDKHPSPLLMSLYLSSVMSGIVTTTLNSISMGSALINGNPDRSLSAFSYLRKIKTSSRVPVIFLFALFVMNMLMNINISTLTSISIVSPASTLTFIAFGAWTR